MRCRAFGQFAAAVAVVASVAVVGGDPDTEEITFAGWNYIDYGTVEFGTPDLWESEPIEIPSNSIVGGDFEISRGNLWGQPEVVVYVVVNDEIIVEYGPFVPPYWNDEDVDFFYDGSGEDHISLKFKVARPESCCKVYSMELAAEYRYTEPSE